MNSLVFISDLAPIFLLDITVSLDTHFINHSTMHFWFQDLLLKWLGLFAFVLSVKKSLSYIFASRDLPLHEKLKKVKDWLKKRDIAKAKQVADELDVLEYFNWDQLARDIEED